MGQASGGGGLRAMLLQSSATAVCLAGIVASWVALAEILQAVQEGGSSYDKPYFMSYLAHSSYIGFLVVWVIVQVVKSAHRRRRRLASVQYSLVLNGEKKSESDGGDTTGSDWREQLRPRLLPTLVYSILLFVVAYTWYLSLSRTIVSVNTAIYNSACAFVFFFSIVVLKEKVSLLKVVAVACCLGGVAMLCVDGIRSSSDNDAHNDVWGYILVIISTILYSFYEVIFKWWGADMEQPTAVVVTNEAPRWGHEEHHHDEVPIVPADKPAADGQGQLWEKLKVVEHTMLFMGLLGLWNALLTWPGIIIVDLIGFEPFELPHGSALAGVLITMGLDSLFNCLLILGIVLSSPLFISVGSLLTIPASVIADWLLHGTVLPVLSYMGMVAIVIGFLLLSLSELLHFRLRKDSERENKGRWDHLVPSLY